VIGLAVRAVGHAIDQAVTLPAPADPPSRDGLVEAGCYALAAASAAALALLANPRSFLSRLVDRPADENAREVTR
jgi:hypothetical protein